MEWLNIHTSTLDAPAFVGADPVQRATWLCLLRYCAGQENGGLIAGCGAWADRRWQQLCRVTLREVRTQSDLWWWDGENVVLRFYPIEKEHEVRANRTNGKLGGRPRSTKNNQEVSGTEPGGSESDNHAASDRRNGREGKGKEGEGEATPTPPSRSHLADTLPAGLMPLSALGVPLHLDGIPAWIASIAGLTESDVADIMRGAAPIRYVREFMALRSAWEAARAKRDETARLRAQRAKQDQERQDREASIAASERKIMDETRVAVALIDADPSLIELADQRTHKSIGYLRTSIEKGHANGISLHAVYRALPEVRAAVARHGHAQAAAGAG